jgi:hypothetical protein
LDPVWFTQDPLPNALDALIAIAPDLILNYIAEISATLERDDA